jgi:predicted DNA-binding protein with PD1-like motif
MEPLPLRLTPGLDLRQALEEAVAAAGGHAGFVVSGIGSLSAATIRFAGIERPELLNGDWEILSLAGSICANGAHLHMSIADGQGRVLGGHVGHGCIIRTTAEVLVLLVPGWSFARELDHSTGYKELVITRP